MGHRVDPNFYNKIWSTDPAYNLGQYRLAERHLDIITQHETVDIEKVFTEQIKDRDAKIAGLEERLTKAEETEPNFDKWFDDNMERIIKKFNEFGVDMKIRKSKRA
jgi:hypothetical protein